MLLEDSPEDLTGRSTRPRAAAPVPKPVAAAAVATGLKQPQAAKAASSKAVPAKALPVKQQPPSAKLPQTAKTTLPSKMLPAAPQKAAAAAAVGADNERKVDVPEVVDHRIPSSAKLASGLFRSKNLCDGLRDTYNVEPGLNLGSLKEKGQLELWNRLTCNKYFQSKNGVWGQDHLLERDMGNMCKSLKLKYGIKPKVHWGTLRDLKLKDVWNSLGCNNAAF